MCNFTSVGIDTHKNSNVVFAIDYKTGETHRAKLNSDPARLIQWLDNLNLTAPVKCVYEAGPTGYELARALRDAGYECDPIAPSKMGHKHDKIKNDQVDAENLCRQYIAGDLTLVYVPTRQEEARAELVRQREQKKTKLRESKQRIRSFLLKYGIKETDAGKPWTKKYIEWCRTLKFNFPELEVSFRALLRDLDYFTLEVEELEEHIFQLVENDKKLKEVVDRLSCLRGFSKLSASVYVLELYNQKRFKKPSALAPYLGLIPSQNDTGSRKQHGNITKCGNKLLRTTLILAANVFMKRRPSGIKIPDDVKIDNDTLMLIEKTNARLFQKRDKMKASGKHPNVIKVALARELAEHVYVLAQL